MDKEKFDRQIRFFGEDGQKKLEKAKVTVVGAGGNGSHVIQQLAYLGVKNLTIIEFDIVESSNMNRLIGAGSEDVMNEIRKIEIAERLCKMINPDINIISINEDFKSDESYKEIIKSDYVFGCFDNDSSRFILNEICSCYEIPYIDLGTDIFTEDVLKYGGRVFVNDGTSGCLYCCDELSMDEIDEELSPESVKQDQEQIYGVSKDDLNQKGPSVVSINGIIASLAVTEFMVMVTEIRSPNRQLTYKGEVGSVFKNINAAKEGCYCCNSLRGHPEKFDIKKYQLIKRR